LQLRKGFLHARSRMADFQHQHAAGRQMVCCVREDAPHEVEAIGPTGKRERGFAAVFRRELAHGGSGHVRRIGNDQVVARPL